MKIFNTLQDLREARFGNVGQIVKVKGHTTEGIGGGEFRIISSAEAATKGYSDTDVTPLLTDGKYGERRVEGFITLEMFGADSSPTDSVEAIENALQFSADFDVVIEAGEVRDFEVSRAVSFPANARVVSSDITLSCATAPVIEFEGGVHDRTEYRGSVSVTGTAPSTPIGAIYMDVVGGCTVNNLNLRGVRYNSPNYGCNGLLVVAGNSVDTNRSRIKNLDISGSVFNTGRMGAEILNQTPFSTVTAATIGTSCVFTATGLASADDGALCIIEDVFSAGEHNGEVFRLSIVTGTTFKLEYADGTEFDSTGLTFSPGGVLRVCRAESVVAKGCIYESTGMASTLGMGISLDNTILNADISESVFKDTPNVGAELIGIINSRLEDCDFTACTGEPFSTSNEYGYGNTVAGNKTSSRSSSRLFISKQVGAKLKDNSFSISGNVTFSEVEDSVISGNLFKATGNYSVIFDGSPNNTGADNVFDNSESASNFSAVRFFGANTIGNVFEKSTILKGSGGAFFDEASGATDNTFRDYRTTPSGDYDRGAVIPVPVSTFGAVSDFGRSPYSGIAEILNVSQGAGYSRYRIKLLITTGNAQPTAQIKINYAGRQNNIPVAGEFLLGFGSFNDFDATPVFAQLGTASLTTVTVDGSGNPYWDVLLPTNNASLVSWVGCHCAESDKQLIEISIVP